MNNITIIGGGLSGMLLSINLLKKASVADMVNVTLIDRNPETDMGPAYSSNDECLLLNVPACRMGAFSTDSGHFLAWARSKGMTVGEWDFLPRKLYKDYVQELLQAALEENKSVTLKRILGEVTDISLSDGRAEVIVNDTSIISDKVVLALGNFPPRNLSIHNTAFYGSKSYFQNPWHDEIFSSLLPDDKVFLIGTGQTTIDVIVRLHARKHTGKIVALSRRGLWPLSHTTFETYPSFYDEIIKGKNMADILRTVRKHLIEAEKKGMDKSAVIDSIRPYTQELWMNLPAQEKSRFLRHLFRYFEIVRSRIPQQSMAVVNQLQQSGQLTILKGRIHDMVERRNHVEIHYLSSDKMKEKTETAAFVINCIGPELDYSKIEDVLVKNLLRKGIIQPDVSRLGIKALSNGEVISRDNEAQDIFYTLGSTMRGILWEVIAAPEIRVQAAQLAHLLLKG